MKKKIFKSGKRNVFMKVANCIAMALVVHAANTACVWVLGQPEEPREVRNMRKF